MAPWEAPPGIRPEPFLPAPTLPRPTVNLSPLAAAVHYLLLLIVLVALLSLARPQESFVYHDSSRDLLLAQAGLEADRFPTVGAPTTIRPLDQGGGWIVHLALLLRLGLEVDDIADLSFALVVLALLALALVGERWWNRTAGFLAAMAGAAVLIALREEWVILWNPTLLPLPSVLLLAAAGEAALRGGRRWWLAAATAAALVCQLHPAGLMSLPALLLLFLLKPPPRSRWLTGAAMGAIVAASALLLSGDAWVGALRGFIDSGLLFLPSPALLPTWPAALALLLIGGAALLRTRHDSRLVTIASFALVPGLALSVLALVWGSPAERYLLPALPAPCLLLGTWLQRLGDWALAASARLRIEGGLLPDPAGESGLGAGRWEELLSPVAALSWMAPVCLLFSVQLSPLPVTWSDNQARVVARDLAGRGLLSDEQVGQALVTPHGWALLPALTFQLRQLGSEPPPAGNGAVDEDESPQRLALLPLVRGDRELPAGYRLLREASARPLALGPAGEAVDWDDFLVRRAEKSTNDAAGFVRGRLALDPGRSSPGFPHWRGVPPAGGRRCTDLVLTLTPDRHHHLLVIPVADLAHEQEVELVSVAGAGLVTGSLVGLPAGGTEPVRAWWRWCYPGPVPQVIGEGIPPVVALPMDDAELLLAAMPAQTASSRGLFPPKAVLPVPEAIPPLGAPAGIPAPAPAPLALPFPLLALVWLFHWLMAGAIVVGLVAGARGRKSSFSAFSQ